MDSYIQDINRIKSLLSYAVIDTAGDDYFDSLSRLVATICNTPIALISFIDDKRQWYKSNVGMDTPELPVEETICQYTLLEEDILEINDTLKDIRLVGNPHVHQVNGIRFYAGISLRSDTGHAIGSVCAADIKPQELNESQREALRDVARLVMLHLNANKQNNQMKEELERLLEEKEEQGKRLLKIQEQLYNNLFEAISQSNAVAEFNTDGTIINLNSQFAEMMGYNDDELIGNKHKLLLDENEQQSYEQFWNSLAEGKPQVGRFKRKHKSGKTVWIQASYCPVVDSEGRITKVTKICQDITREVLASDALEELSLQKDSFIANISHELRTPIHAIIGFSGLLLEKEHNADKFKKLQSIKTAGDSLLYLVNDILDLSKIEAGLFQFDHVDFQLREIVESVFSILNFKAVEKKIRFFYNIDSDVSQQLSGDKVRLSQVLVNLLDNALKFTSEGEVRLHIACKESKGDKQQLQFTVSDTGIGIPENKLENIFERFTQAEKNTARHYGGTGLGLNICKLLVEKQGGSITVESTPGKGTKFSFILDFEIPEEGAHSIQNAVVKDHRSLSGNILMCEDNEINRELAHQLFKSTNLSLDVAESGKIGIELVKKKQYDLILMDIQMPEMDGYQTTVYIRNTLNLTVPIVALTAHSMIMEKEKCLEIGMNDYLSKPFRKEELFDKISYWMEASKANNTLPFSMEYLHESSGGNKDFEKQMLMLLLKNNSVSMEHIRQFYKDHDLDAISREAHKLKTAFGMYAIDMSVLGLLEHETRTIDLPACIGQLSDQMDEIEQHIKQLIEHQYASDTH